MFCPRIVIAGTQSGVGKTTLSLAIMAALAKRGLAVQPFKVGPDYIDPSLHHRATGRLSCNLDAWLMSEKDLQALYYKRAATIQSAPGAGEREQAPGGISVIEGVMGLYDGHANTTWSSTAHVASLLKAPVLLVVNARGMSLSAAALVSGYADFAAKHGEHTEQPADLSSMHIAGVLLNQVSSDRHFDVLKKSIEENTGIPCFGYVGKGTVPALPQRHLGLVPAWELEELDLFFSQLADMAEDRLDLSRIIECSHSAPLLAVPDFAKQPNVEGFSTLRIGVPRDEAFAFYYPENLQLLEDLGVTLVYFSPLRDSHLPPGLDGLYMGGGFPEVFAEALEANVSFRTTLASALEGGLPAYAECGGMMYLCTSLTGLPVSGKRFIIHDHEERPFSMVGFFDDRVEMTDRLQPFGYIKVTLLRDCVLGKAGTTYRAHEFHYARLQDESSEPLFRIEKDDGRNWTGGLCRENVVAGFPHLHFYGCPEIATAFLTSCLQRKMLLEHSL